MYAQPGTWGDVWPYGYIMDRQGVAWKILEEKNGWVQLQSQDGRIAAQMRPADDVPVTLLLADEQEAMAALYRVFPGAQIIDITHHR